MSTKYSEVISVDQPCQYEMNFHTDMANCPDCQRRFHCGTVLLLHNTHTRREKISISI
jgi:hypothetical protein